MKSHRKGPRTSNDPGNECKTGSRARANERETLLFTSGIQRPKIAVRKVVLSSEEKQGSSVSNHVLPILCLGLGRQVERVHSAAPVIIAFVYIVFRGRRLSRLFTSAW